MYWIGADYLEYGVVALRDKSLAHQLALAVDVHAVQGDANGPVRRRLVAGITNVHRNSPTIHGITPLISTANAPNATAASPKGG